MNEGQALGRPPGENWMMQTKILYREKTPKQTFKRIAPVHSKAKQIFKRIAPIHSKAATMFC